jgi:hypothetical protein
MANIRTEAPKAIQVKVNIANEQSLAKFVNFSLISVTKEEGEVVIDFIYINRSQVNKETKEVNGSHVDRIAMTIPQAKKFAEKLSELLSKI